MIQKMKIFLVASVLFFAAQSNAQARVITMCGLGDGGFAPCPVNPTVLLPADAGAVTGVIVENPSLVQVLISQSNTQPNTVPSPIGSMSGGATISFQNNCAVPVCVGTNQATLCCSPQCTADLAPDGGYSDAGPGLVGIVLAASTSFGTPGGFYSIDADHVSGTQFFAVTAPGGVCNPDAGTFVITEGK